MEQFIKIDNNILEYNLYNLPQLVLEVTDKCNLRCAYCAFSDLYDNRRCHSAGDMTFDMAKVIIDYLVETWNKYSNVYMPKRFNIGFYGGEPTLNFQLISDVVNYIEKIKCNIPGTEILLSSYNRNKLCKTLTLKPWEAIVTE